MSQFSLSFLLLCKRAGALTPCGRGGAGDRIVLGFDRGCICMIITSIDAHQVADPLMKALGRAVTRLSGTGMYSGVHGQHHQDEGQELFTFGLFHTISSKSL